MVYIARSKENFGIRYYLTDGEVTTEPRDWSLDLLDHGQIAVTLGATSNQVYMWKRRATSNGFPDPVATKPVTGRKRGYELWLASEVQEWYEAYVPSKGGRRRAGD